MVVYDSQYRKQYQDPHWDQFAVSEYARKLDYRIGRRSVEHVHQPWGWDSEEEESEVENSKRQVERCQTTKGNTNRQRKETLTQKDSVTQEETLRATKQHKQKKHHEKRHKQQEKQLYQKEHEPTKEKEPRQERPQRRRPRRQIKSASSKPKPQTAMKKEPFVFYGWANEGPIDKKYTYNVRANPSEVYPASMRALKRHELEVKRRQYEKQQKAVVEQELEKEKLFKDRQLNSTFLTEYQRSYCLQNDVKLGYDLD